jgi:hypothetical protein
MASRSHRETILHRSYQEEIIVEARTKRDAEKLAMVMKQNIEFDLDDWDEELEGSYIEDIQEIEEGE